MQRFELVYVNYKRNFQLSQKNVKRKARRKTEKCKREVRLPAPQGDLATLSTGGVARRRAVRSGVAIGKGTRQPRMRAATTALLDTRGEVE